MRPTPMSITCKVASMSILRFPILAQYGVDSMYYPNRNPLPVVSTCEGSSL